MSDRLVTLIDGDPDLNAQLAQELSRYGLRVETLADANDLMARKDDLPQLVVLCIDPKRTGWAVCNRLRKSNQLKAVPLVITSAEATEKDFEDHKKLKTRAEEYLHKPFDAATLLDKIAGLIGLPDMGGADLQVPLESEEISIDDAAVVEDAAADPFEHQATDSRRILGNGFGEEDDRTRIAVMQIDRSVNEETDMAFAAIGIDEPEATSNTPPSIPSVVVAAPDETVANLSDDDMGEVELDLGLEDVARQAEAESSRAAPLPTAPRPAGVVSSVAAPESDTVAHRVESSPRLETTRGVDPAELEAMKQERDGLKRELEALRAKPKDSGFSREKEFLNLREVINKKEKEVLDLRDSLDSKERQILDGKDKLREAERKLRDLDEKALVGERELVSGKEKIEALGHDKERAVEREKQVKARLDDALKTVGRYEEELETIKKRHAADIGGREETFNNTVAEHQAELLEQRQQHHAAVEALTEQQAQATQELESRYSGERRRMEEDFARQTQQLKESAANEREGLRLRLEQASVDMRGAHEAEMDEVRAQHLQATALLEERHAAATQELAQHHADELGGLRARYTNDTKALERKQAEDLAALRSQAQADLANADTRRVAELATKEEEHRVFVENTLNAHAAEKARLTHEHDEALRALDETRLAEINQARRDGAAEVARVSQEAATKNEGEIKALRESHSFKLQALEESHTEAKAGMQQRHNQAFEELKTQHASTINDYNAAIKERDDLITDGHTRIAELEDALGREQEQVRGLQAQKTDLEGRLQTAQADIVERDRRVKERDGRIHELEQESSGYQDQILKAYQRIKSDESLVSRAKKALAIALTLLDESAPEDNKEEASS